MSQDIESHLLSDLAEIWFDELRRFRVKVRRSPDPVETGIAYYSTLQKLVWPRPRAIRRATGFECPPHVTPALAIVEDEIARGANLTRRLSKRVWKANFKDGLLNHWRIHHLHLAKKGSDHLLFARFEPDTAYLLAVMPHEDRAGVPNFDEPRLYRTLEDNWPELLGSTLPGITAGRTPRLDKETIAKARRAGVSVLMPTPQGGVRVEPGGGVMTSRDSASAVDAALDAAHLLDRVKQQAAADYARHAGTSGSAPPAHVALRLTGVQGERLFVEGKPSGWAITYQVGRQLAGWLPLLQPTHTNSRPRAASS